MNHIQILKRAWYILLNYKTLWVFGIILAIVSGGYSGNGGGSGGRGTPSTPGGNNFELPAEVQRWFDQINKAINFNFDEKFSTTLIIIGASLASLLLILIIVSRIAYYVSQVSLIRMVDRHEATEEKVSWRQGLRLGWSRSAGRLFLIDLIIFLPLAFVIIILFGCAALPIVLPGLEGSSISLPSIIASIGMAFMVIFAIVVISVLVSFFLETIRRVCVLGEYGALEAIQQGLALVRHHLKDVGLMWLIMIGLGLGVAIVFIILFLPVAAISGLVAAGVGLAAYSVSNMVVSDITAIIMAAVLAGLTFIGVFGIPMTFLSGLRETYFSSVWTLTYRELRALEAGETE